MLRELLLFSREQHAGEDAEAQHNQHDVEAGVDANLVTVVPEVVAGVQAEFEGDKEQQQAQNEINGQLEAWAYKNNASLNDLTAYKALISGNMGGSATASGTSSGGGSGGAGALASIGGSALGSYLGSS